MLPIRGVYEVAIRVRDLGRSETFYREVLGLEVGIRDEARKWLFLRAGGEAGMVVLQETPGVGRVNTLLLLWRRKRLTGASLCCGRRE